MLEIIGVGYGRTGTLSLKHALEMLGYGQCYHFSVLLKRAHAKRWLKVINQEPQHWETLFDAYRSTTDWPAAAYYRELARVYPDAKFILTVRHADDWYNSANSTIFKLRTIMPGWLPGFRSVAKLTDLVVWNGTFHGRFRDKEYAIHCYNQHIDQVCRSVPAKQLLVFDVRDGWAPLCAFLDEPVPQGVVFPSSNDRAQMQRYIKWLKAIRLCLIGLPIVLLLYLIALVLKT